MTAQQHCFSLQLAANDTTELGELCPATGARRPVPGTPCPASRARLCALNPVRLLAPGAWL